MREGVEGDIQQVTSWQQQHPRTQPGSSAGTYIQNRFTQKDLQHRAVVYVISPDQEVTSDSFQFRLSDPAGNSAAPET